MQPQQGRYVRDLKAWELPRLEDLEAELVDKLAIRASDLFGDREGFEERLHTLFFDPLRAMAGVAVNEIIEYWLKGLADGNDGQFPEFCVEFPYLERNENTDSLTLAYCVDNEDGTRTELNRVTLERALMRVVEETVAPAGGASRLKVMACELRALAARLDEMGTQLSR
jgi:hypothetical protein